MDTLKDLMGYLRVHRKFWLLPLIVVILTLSLIIVFSSGSAVAPFIYTLF